ncbi:uncharacterized protein LOC129816895 isoform X1 [Salvelinus fontinalis]|uniref:uncharacterized protein LOC129816895 isoform X1 n=1 Tax=Salvelinus fontinalis TaxID=8038 RepID=UPI0024864C79|nr:uncharacterized protein LOC129816895 isoform X1 [Salvelinus fontinalis]
MNTYPAAFWSDDSSSSFDECRDRTTHHKRTKQRGNREQCGMDSWAWEEILDGKGPWAQPGEYRRPKEELEAARAERRHYEELARGNVHERQPQNVFGRRHTGRLVESGRRPEPTPRAYCGERVTGQAPCYAVKRTVSPVCMRSPVRYIAAPRIGRARVGIEPGRMMPAQRIWSPVRLLGPGYPAPALRTVSPVRLHSPVRPVPAPRTCRAKVTIQPGRVVQARCSRPPVRLHDPVYPVPRPRTRPPACLPSLVSCACAKP